MITVLEEAQNMADGIRANIEMTFDRFVSDPDLSSILYLMAHNMRQLCDLLYIAETEDITEAPAESCEDTTGANETNHTKNITYEEMMSKQYLETDDLHEIPVTKGTLDALDEVSL